MKSFNCFIVIVFLTMISSSLMGENENEKLKLIQHNIKETQKKRLDLEKEAKNIEKNLLLQKETLNKYKRALTNIQKRKTITKKEKLQITKRLKSLNKRLLELEDVYIKLFTFIYEYEYLNSDDDQLKTFLILFLNSTQEYLDIQFVMNKNLGVQNREIVTKLNSIDKQYRLEKGKINTQKKIIIVGEKSLTKRESERIELANALKKYREEETKIRKIIAEINRNKAKTTVPYSYTFSSNKLIWPVSGIVQNYFRTAKNSGDGLLLNDGIDILPENNLVVAVEDGLVVYSAPFSNKEKLIVIDHKNGYRSIYKYKGETYVSKNDSVKKNQVIAKLNELTSTLHFEIRRDTDPIDPLTMLLNK